MLLALTGCDDFVARTTYDQSEIGAGAKEGLYDVGDSLFSDPELVRVCILARYERLNNHVTHQREVEYGEDLRFIILTFDNGNEIVEWLHWSVLEPPGGNTICTNDPRSIKVIEFDRVGRMHVNLMDKPNG